MFFGICDVSTNLLLPCRVFPCPIKPHSIPFTASFFMKEMDHAAGVTASAKRPEDKTGIQNYCRGSTDMVDTKLRFAQPS